VCVGDWTYGGNMVLVNEYMEVLYVLLNGHMEVVCFGEWIYGGTVCVGEWTYGVNVVLVNGYMEVLLCW